MVNSARRHEFDIADEAKARGIKAKRNAYSGSKLGNLDDEIDIFLSDAKLSSSKPSFSMSAKVWSKIDHQARINGKCPAAVIKMLEVHDDLFMCRYKDILGLLEELVYLRKNSNAPRVITKKNKRQ